VLVIIACHALAYGVIEYITRTWRKWRDGSNTYYSAE